jgi:hypothetical protein
MKQKTFAILALAIVLIAAFSLPDGFAKNGAQSLPASSNSYIRTSLQGVSDPSGSCSKLGLNGKYGTVTLAHGEVVLSVQNADPPASIISQTFSVWVGYRANGGTCDGNWHSIGSVTVAQSGNGEFSSTLSGLVSSLQYVIELRDAAGNPVYATGMISP